MGKLGKLGKGAAVLKGAKVLGVGVAAERVFLYADDIGRVGVFVADDGSGALKVVMKGGDEVAHTADSFKGLVGDLDEMAKVADDAGVDVSSTRAPWRTSTTWPSAATPGSSSPTPTAPRGRSARRRTEPRRWASRAERG